MREVLDIVVYKHETDQRERETVQTELLESLVWRKDIYDSSPFVRLLTSRGK